MTNIPFIHLRVQSAYSMLEGALHPKEIAKASLAQGMPAVGLTDRNNLHGAMEFCEECMLLGVQPLVGVLLSLARASVPAPAERQGVQPSLELDHLVLFAKDTKGYENLIYLVSRAHLAVETTQPPHLLFEDMDGHSQGLIALTAGAHGGLARLVAQGQQAAAEQYLERLKSLFPDRLYIEISRTGEALEHASEAGLLSLAYAHNLPLVATNPVLFLTQEGYSAHDMLSCIAQGRYVEEEDRPRLNPHLWFKPSADMATLFADLPEALANTLLVAQRCAVKAPERKPILPIYTSAMPEADLLRQRAQAGLQNRLQVHVYPLSKAQEPQALKALAQPYQDRLDYELGVIEKMGFAGYFLIVSDFIQWAKDQDIPVGPGRGSGAGSVVAWALSITDLDPLRLGLLFERFLNPERVSMPDFDIDFCETRREEVIRYVQAKYGKEHVAQIITFGKMKARAVLKDVGRALQMPYGQMDRLAKLIPNHPSDPFTLERALKEVPELRQARAQDQNVTRLIDAALQLEGVYRHASTHAAGVVIGDRPLEQLVPLIRDAKSDMVVTQFDMKWVEKAGLVKFDFLGLKTLSVLKYAVDLLARRAIEVDLLRLPWNDRKTFELLSRGDTVGVFQLESEGMRRTLSQVLPDKFEDIIALVALYRPGPMDNIPSYANRKHGREQPDYLHPLLQPILEETYGVIIYQEQVMQIAQTLAGYSLGEADLLRRAMGKKKKSEMDAQAARFIEGAQANGVSAEQASTIFQLVEKFAGYGFNKSHAAAYALLAYQTAWLKANHPVEFYAASMTYDRANTDKLAQYVEDIKRSDITLLPPDINASYADFSVELCQNTPANSENATLGVRYALSALKGVGEKAMQALVAEREAGGIFRSLGDFASRIDPRLINRKSLESLVGGGALDSLHQNRAGVHNMIERILAQAANVAQERQSAQVSLFGEPGKNNESRLEILIPKTKPWPIAEAMAAEKAAFGFYLSAHPLDAYRLVLQQHKVITSAELLALEPSTEGRRSVVLAGLPEEFVQRPGKDGKRFTLLVCSDQAGLLRYGCFEETVVEQARQAMLAKAPVLIRAELVWRPGEEMPRVNARDIKPLDNFADKITACLTITLKGPSALADLHALSQSHLGGRGKLVLRAHLGDKIASLTLPHLYKVDDNLRDIVRHLPDVVSAELL